MGVSLLALWHNQALDWKWLFRGNITRSALAGNTVNKNGFIHVARHTRQDVLRGLGMCPGKTPSWFWNTAFDLEIQWPSGYQSRVCNSFFFFFLSMQFLNPYYCFLSFNKYQPDAYSVPCSIPARTWLQAKVKQGNAKFFLFQLLSAFFGWLSRRKGYSPSSKLNYWDFQQIFQHWKSDGCVTQSSPLPPHGL